MNRFIALFCILLTLIACEKENGPSEAELWQAKIENDIYDIISIEYTPADNVLSYESESMPTFTYTNNTSSTVSFSQEIITGWSETSDFVFTTAPEFEIKIEEKPVNTPRSYINNSFFLDQRWNYSKNTNSQELSPLKSGTLSLSPYFQVVWDAKINFEIISAYYTMKVKGRETNEIFTLEGSWKGKRRFSIEETLAVHLIAIE